MQIGDSRWQGSPNFKSRTKPIRGEFSDGLIRGFNEVLLLNTALASK